MSFLKSVRRKAGRLVDRMRSSSPVPPSQWSSPQALPHNEPSTVNARISSRQDAVVGPPAADPSGPLVVIQVTTPSRSSSLAPLTSAPSVLPPLHAGHAEQRSQLAINNHSSSSSSNVNNGPGGTIINTTNNSNVTQVISRDQAAEDLNTIERGLGQLHVSRALYDAQPLTAGCTDGTRVQLLSNTQNLLTSRDGPHIVWIAGMAGTGKTSIALTLCRRLAEEPTVLLAGTFFCSRSAGVIERTDAQRIIPTLVILIARQVPEYARALAAELKEDPDLGSKVAGVQVERLFVKPLESVGASNRQIVFVIDALDECRNQAELVEVIDALADFSTTMPVKFLLTSRPEIHIRGTAITDRSLSSIVQLHMVDEALVTSDIRLYIRKSLEKDSKSLKWYTDDDIDDLATLSAGIFIFASTVLAYILRRKDAPGRSERLRTVKQQAVESAIATDPLDKMYSLVLMQASDPSAYEPTELDETRRIVAVILSIRSPLTVKALADLLGISAEHLRGALDELHAVIFVPEQDDEGELRALHASFGDYIFTRAAVHIRIERSLGHDELVRACLERMTADDLCFNISRSRSSYESNSKTQPDWIGHSLFYACLNWTHHIDLVSEGSSFYDRIASVLRVKLLFWLEVLSLMGKVDRAAKFFRFTAKKLSSPDVSQFFRDADSFVTSFRDAINRSAPHIYISAMAFAPKNSLVYQTFSPHLIGIPEFEVFRDSSSNDRSIRVQSVGGATSPNQTLGGHTGGVLAIAISPDGHLIASASNDRSARVWDVQTCEQVYPPLLGHEGPVRAVAFSLDGRWIATGSDDRTLRLWNAQTGQFTTIELRGHTRSVTAISFAPNCLHLASGSGDRTVRVWEVSTGQPAEIPQMKSVNFVSSVSYSPSGAVIAVVSNGGGHQIFDAVTGQEIQRFNTESEWSGPTSLAFSPDGTVFGTALWTDVKVFDVHTDQRVMNLKVDHEPNSGVTAVAYSPDGKFIACCTMGYSVLFWRRDGKNALESLPSGHAKDISSVTFSSDGRFLITGSEDSTIRILDLEKIRLLANGKNESPLTALALARYETKGGPIQTTGWMVSPSDQLLLWVPPEHRGFLEIGSHSQFIATHRAAITAEHGVLHQGEEWVRCWRSQNVPAS